MAVMTSTDSLNINASVEDVYALLADIHQHPMLFDVEVSEFHGGQAAPGDSWVTTAPFMGRELQTEWTFVEADPPSRLVFTGESDAASTRLVWEMHPVDGGTELSYNSEGEPKGFLAAVGAQLLKGNFKKLLRESMERIKATLEG